MSSYAQVHEEMCSDDVMRWRVTCGSRAESLSVDAGYFETEAEAVEFALMMGRELVFNRAPKRKRPQLQIVRAA